MFVQAVNGGSNRLLPGNGKQECHMQSYVGRGSVRVRVHLNSMMGPLMGTFSPLPTGRATKEQCFNNTVNHHIIIAFGAGNTKCDCKPSSQQAQFVPNIFHSDIFIFRCIYCLRLDRIQSIVRLSVYGLVPFFGVSFVSLSFPFPDTAECLRTNLNRSFVLSLPSIAEKGLLGAKR